MHLTVTKRRIMLYKLPAGSLFRYNDTIAIKTEYSTHSKPECYIIGSGEYFYPVTMTELPYLLVHQIHLHP